MIFWFRSIRFLHKAIKGMGSDKSFDPYKLNKKRKWPLSDKQLIKVMDYLVFNKYVSVTAGDPRYNTFYAHVAPDGYFLNQKVYGKIFTYLLPAAVSFIVTVITNMVLKSLGWI